MLDFSNHKFRCSSLGNLMTNQQGKKDTTCIEEISETAKKELIKIYIAAKYGRTKELVNKYVTKGLSVEEDSITLLSRVKRMPFFKNEIRIENEFITGEADVTVPYLMDTKSSWDIFTFYDAKTAKKLNPVYEWQMQGYCELYDFMQGSVCYCLIDTPSGLIEDEKRKMFYKMNVTSQENPDYLQACEALEKNLTYSDIPMEERIHEVIVKHSPAAIESVYKRAELWRTWLNEFANKAVKELA